MNMGSNSLRTKNCVIIEKRMYMAWNKAET